MKKYRDWKKNLPKMLLSLGNPYRPDFFQSAKTPFPPISGEFACLIRVPGPSGLVFPKKYNK